MKFVRELSTMMLILIGLDYLMFHRLPSIENLVAYSILLLAFWFMYTHETKIAPVIIIGVTIAPFVVAYFEPELPLRFVDVLIWLVLMSALCGFEVKRIYQTRQN